MDHVSIRCRGHVYRLPVLAGPLVQCISGYWRWYSVILDYPLFKEGKIINWARRLSYFKKKMSYLLTYQVGQAVRGIRQLFSIPEEDVDACIAAYRYLQVTQLLSHNKAWLQLARKHIFPISQHLVFLAGGVIRSEHFHGQAGTSELDGKHSVTDQETEHVRRYYTVLQPLLRIADIEKMFVWVIFLCVYCGRACVACVCCRLWSNTCMSSTCGTG